MLALAYGFFTLAAGARSTVQLAAHPDRALTAYVLSAVSAAIYLSGMVLVAQADRGRWQRAAVVVCLAEVLGVVGVGTLSLTRPDLFPDASVWSGYGSGYGYVPAVLPLLALAWLHRLPGRAGPSAEVASRAEGSQSLPAGRPVCLEADGPPAQAEGQQPAP
ncbi:hypothetical protein [uncultured Friedmanniella sp.]|uniref:hypothetical protein n=1 Tax=uncultured Friedmanniella sp. TaxID=335381 RepID=UPI0035CC08EA